MDKKEIESSKLTARFLIWITGFLIVLFALIAHFVWKVFWRAEQGSGTYSASSALRWTRGLPHPSWFSKGGNH